MKKEWKKWKKINKNFLIEEHATYLKNKNI
jgi:hypothetical protein